MCFCEASEIAKLDKARAKVLRDADTDRARLDALQETRRNLMAQVAALQGENAWFGARKRVKRVPESAEMEENGSETVVKWMGMDRKWGENGEWINNKKKNDA